MSCEKLVDKLTAAREITFFLPAGGRDIAPLDQKFLSIACAAGTDSDNGFNLSGDTA